MLTSLVPSVAWLRQYQPAWLRHDVTAGSIAAAVVVPKAMAYATIAGLPLRWGIEELINELTPRRRDPPP